VDLSPCSFRHIRLPIATVGRLAMITTMQEHKGRQL
jgi:hypothetical protein